MRYQAHTDFIFWYQRSYRQKAVHQQQRVDKEFYVQIMNVYGSAVVEKTKPLATQLNPV
jgi:hypothetical protein